MIVFILGYMGSGKSKAGKALARLLGYKSKDTDSMICEKTGISIQEIFQKMGEEKFREMERDVIRAIPVQEHVVIATGGGLPLFFDNMTYMNGAGITVFLEASAGLLYQRLVKNRDDRPLISRLNADELRNKINNDLQVRNPVYQKARIKVNAADIDLKSLAAELERCAEENQFR